MALKEYTFSYEWHRCWQSILSRIGSGDTLKRAIYDVLRTHFKSDTLPRNVPITGFLNYLRRNPGKWEQYQRARAAQMEVRRADADERMQELCNIFDKALKGEHTVGEGEQINPTLLRNAADNLHWLMSKLDPDTYGDKKQVKFETGEKLTELLNRRYADEDKKEQHRVTNQKQDQLIDVECEVVEAEIEELE